MKARNRSLTATQQATSAKSIVNDPVTFAEKILGANLWELEAKILQSIRTQRRTAVKACHGVGKTFVLAVATLWWLVRYPEGIVLTTSPTERQVRTQLWSEIHRMAQRARLSFPKLKLTELKLRSDSNFAMGFSTNQAANFQGYHGKNVLIIADEAPGIDPGIWDAISGTMAGGNVHIVMAGNPITSSGAFFDAFTNDRGLWICITIGAFDSPNLQGLDLPQLLLLDPAEGGPLDQNPFPYLVTKRWVRDQHLEWWHGSDSSSPNWVSRVMAQFPDQSEFALIKMAWLERAGPRAGLNPIFEASSLVAGIDVSAGGQAETVVYICERYKDRSRIVAMGAWRGDDTRGHVVNLLNQHRSRLSTVRVDSIGPGYHFAQHLRDFRFLVEMVNVASPCESKPNRKENDPARRFANLKAFYYQTLADSFERDQIEGLTDETTIGQLAGILYEIDSQGRVKIESKEDARKRGIRSPDRAEALMLALGRPQQTFEYYSERNPPGGHGATIIDDDYHPDDQIVGNRGGRWETLAPGRLSRHFPRGGAF